MEESPDMSQPRVGHSDDHTPVDPPELARRINRLFDVMHARTAPPPSTSAAAAAITARGAVPMSPSTLERLRSDCGATSSHAELTAIAEFFGVSTSYLTDAAAGPGIDAQLDTLRALRDAGVGGPIRTIHACSRPPAASI